MSWRPAQSNPLGRPRGFRLPSARAAKLPPRWPLARLSMAPRLLPARTVMRGRRLGAADGVIAVGLILLFILIAKLGADAHVHFAPPTTVPHISLSPWLLPYYAAPSTLRMFVGLFCSLLFTLAHGYAAAKSRRLSHVLLPLLDILQSVPVLGFLSVTVTAFIAL